MSLPDLGVDVRVAVLVGNPKPASRTLAAAGHTARAVIRAAGFDLPAAGGYTTVDLAPLGPRALDAEPSEQVAIALAAVTAADLLVVASPTYKGTYTGLLKAFLDRLPSAALTGTVALPVLVAGAARHALAVELHLRPLLVELGATVPTPGLALLEADLPNLGRVVTPWAERVAPAVRALVRREALL